MSVGIIPDDSVPISVRTQRGPTHAAAPLASNCPMMAGTVKVRSLLIELMLELNDTQSCVYAHQSQQCLETLSLGPGRS